MSKPLKIGLLGAGYILDSHAQALQNLSGVILQAIGDSSRTRAVRAAAKYSVPQIATSIEEMGRTDCDAVHVLLPPPLHLEAASMMVEAGKSVFLEKPMGLDSKRCADLSLEARRRGLAVGVNHNFLFSRGYEALRQAVNAGELGRLDHIAANWHFAFPVLQFGPFDSWPVAAPANLIFELGSHIAAFVVDLIGLPDVISADAANPITLPGGQTVYRHWTCIVRKAKTTAVLSISVTTGQADRSLYLRGRGGSAQLDFGRDILWRNGTTSDNPLFDAYATAHSAGKALGRQARADRARRLRAALAKRPDANPFEESVFRSIRAFYTNGLQRVDSRHDGNFGAEVISLCQNVAKAAGVGQPSSGPGVAVRYTSPLMKPTVLIVGGTGFIGRRLVRRLAEQGYGLRVLTRNKRAAAIDLDGLPMEVISGWHGDRTCVQAALQGIEFVYHLAKCEGKRWADYEEGDIAPTRVLAEASAEAGVRRFIYTGTIASYASDSSRSTIDNRTPVDAHILNRGHYARSKAACEALLRALHRGRGLPLVILRPGIVLGPGSPPAHPGVAHFMSETRVDFWGDGANRLPLVLVDDVADALVRALQVSNIDGQTLLLTSPPLLTAREYVAALAEHMGTRIDARVRPAWRYWMADMVKELAKNAVRHPNRRWPSLHDWRCNSHAARYDSGMTEEVLGWHPVSDRETMITRGIVEPVDWYVR